MHPDRQNGILGRSLVTLAVATALAGCGGSGDAGPIAGTMTGSVAGVVTRAASVASLGTPPGPSGSNTTGNSSTSTPPSAASGGTGTSTGPTSGGSGSGPSSAPPAGGTPPVKGTSTVILFEQPLESGIAGHLLVPRAVHISPPKGVFAMILWQPNPANPGGLLVPTTWDAGSQTGFTPSSPLNVTQLGFQDRPGTSTAQVDGDAVGAYLNSSDLPGSPTDQKMMITPQFIWATGSQPVPFSNSASVLSAAMDLQIPVAMGNSTYVVTDFLFEGPNGVRISYGVKLFNNGANNPLTGGGYNTAANVYELNSPLGVDPRFVTQAPGSGAATGIPWSGWRHFEWSVTQAQFVAALNYLSAAHPGVLQSTDPSQYLLAEVHLNAEFHFQPAPAELGWSMRGWRVSLTGPGG